MSYIGYIPATFKDQLAVILDDDPSVCESLSAAFRLEGFQTASGTTTEEFFLAAEGVVPPTVVIANPGVADDQFSFLRSLRNVSRRATLFTLQEAVDGDAAVFAMQVGAHGVLVKPVDQRELVQTVKSALVKNAGIPPAFDDVVQFIADIGPLGARKSDDCC